jgi:hypothetical protein
LEEFERRIDEAREDPVELKKIADELLSNGDPSSRALAIKAIALRAKALKRQASSKLALQMAVPTSQIEWLARFGLPRPDGRPLYRYALASAVFAQLQNYLAERAGSMGHSTTKADAGLFVLWAAEWFRRCYRGGVQRWEDVGRPIGLTFEYWQGWKSLADTGLKFWGIRPLRINGTHHRLAAIARQGGFPVAALEGGSTGWAARYLKQLVGLLLGDSNPTLDTADGHAERLAGTIPELWRGDEMRIVSAELAFEVVRLRREAEEGGAISGWLVSAWLDQFRPGWRDELPLPVDGDAARALVDDLLRVVPLKGGSGAINVTRRLRIRGGTRLEMASLSLDGIIDSSGGRPAFKLLADQWSRLRLYASGLFGQFASGELAIAEPAEDDRWIARATVIRSDIEVPFSVPIQVELRGEGRRACDPFLMSGGERVGDGLRVFVTNSENEDPEDLILSGAGSGSYRAEPLYVSTPEGWSAEVHDESSSCTIFHGPETGRQIWTVTGSARIVSDSGDLYLVRAGQKGEKRDILSLVGSAPRGCAAQDPAIPLYLGVPRLEVSDGGRARSPGPGEAWWRPKNERTWRSLDNAKVEGRVEFAWRDAATGHMRDRKEAVVLPAAFEISRNNTEGGTSLIVAGWSGDIRLDHGDRTGPGTWRFAKGSKWHSTCARLHNADGADIHLTVPLPHNASVDHWTDGPVAPNSTISISTLSRFVARSQGRCELLADLIDRQKRRIGERSISWWVEGELPLSAIRDDITALLRPFGDLDARVKLNFNDANEDYWFVSEFELDLRMEGRGLVPNRAVPEGGTEVVGRSLQRPAKERDFCRYGLLDNLNHRPIELPKLDGDWLIYLRQDDRVISRPYFVGGEPTEAPVSGLASAMAERNSFVRSDALDRLCDGIATEPETVGNRTIIRSIIDLALSLDGLPPATFDIFIKFDTHPFLGPLLLFQATPTEIEALIRLADGLPFCWLTIPKRYWEMAAQAEFEALHRAMPNSIPLCAEAISSRRAEICSLEPALAPLLDLSTPQMDLMEAAQSFLNRSGDRIPEHMRSPFRCAFSGLPEWNVSSHFLRDLDAPVVAAIAAREAVCLDAEHVYCIKDVARRDPRYFREAFAAAFKEHSIG